MPTGAFFGDQLSGVRSGDDNRSPTSGTGMTGTGAPSNPRWSLDTPMPTAGGTGMTNTGPRYAGGSGFSEPPRTPGGYGAFDAVQNIPTTGRETGLYGLPGQNPRTEPSPTNLLAQQQLGIQQMVNTMYGPQQQILADQLARQREQLGLLGVDADYRSDALRRDTALARQLLGIDKQALGTDTTLTKTQQANLGRLRAILTKQYGLAGEQLANQLAGFGIDEAQVRDQAKRQVFDLRSALTARGAFNTVANDRGTGRVNRDLMYQLGQIGVGRDAARINNRGTLLGLDEKGIGYDNQAAALQHRLANIGLDYARIGINEQQLANSLQDGLHQIGLDTMVSVNGLLDAIGGTNAQQAALAATILQEVMGYSNLPPEVRAEVLRALGVYMDSTAPDSTANDRDKKVPGSRVPA